MKIFVSIILALFVSTAQADITAKSWLVTDDQGRTIAEKSAWRSQSIASITKLMTAMVILDSGQDLNESLGVFTRNDLLQLMLIKSDNAAAETLCEHYPTGRFGCIGAMNIKAHNLGLTNTYYSDPSGLGIMNISTAQELIKIVLAAGEYPDIVRASNTIQGTIKNKKRFISFNNTNPLVATKNFIVSKTGYIRASGGCIVMMLDTKIGRRIVVLLNSRDTRSRIPEANQLAMRF